MLIFCTLRYAFRSPSQSHCSRAVPTLTSSPSRPTPDRARQRRCALRFCLVFPPPARTTRALTTARCSLLRHPELPVTSLRALSPARTQPFSPAPRSLLSSACSRTAALACNHRLKHFFRRNLSFRLCVPGGLQRTLIFVTHVTDA